MTSRHAAYRKRLRDQVLDGYGAECECCKETHRSMLEIDHVNGGGNAERRAGIKSAKLCKLIIEKKWPDTYRLLCSNCNHSRAIKGYCPHEDEQPEWILKRINHWRRVLYQMEKQVKELPK